MQYRVVLRQLAKGLSNLIAPNVCRVCGQSLTTDEDVLCLGCLLEVPRTFAHCNTFNEIHRRLGHHYRVNRAAAWFHYKKNTPYAQLLVDAKYNGLHRIDRILGRICAQELSDDHFFDGMDLLVPMPMFWTKRLFRGYNQAVEICRGISDVNGMPYTETLKAVKSHGTQSHHGKDKRYTSIAGTMAVSDPTEIAGKHILLVDDIITSGASCMEALRAIDLCRPASMNVLALGLTHHN